MMIEAAAVCGLIGLAIGYMAALLFSRRPRGMGRSLAAGAAGAGIAGLSLPRLGLFGSADLLSYVLAAMIGATVSLLLLFFAGSRAD